MITYVYRWKGENVATYEVANVMTKLAVIHDANVYGVEIPGTGGYLIFLFYRLFFLFHAMFLCLYGHAVFMFYV